MPEQFLNFPSGGALPGIPGEHAPGAYWIDYEKRTIRPAQSPDASSTQEPQAAQADVATEIAHLEDEIHTLTAEQQQSN